MGRVLDQAISSIREPATVLAISIVTSAPLLRLTHERNPISRACLIFMLAGFASAIPADTFRIALVGALPAVFLPMIVISDMNTGRAGSGDAGLATGVALIASIYTVLSVIFGSACGFVFREVIWGKASKHQSQPQDFVQRTKFAAVMSGISLIAFALIH
jgi:hypothetical protein